ncbi:hypothetical protein IV501_05785 [Lacisediminihabitans sp. G11-30]|uniref:Uncharacterized protein n=1 Tax=Lacisediminihabitans changchengi TaxID=2787634 RepID=A0A934SKP6_9MICO|nr:DUF6114 domain-containing protein [Lacisediminihabitans changchengi]MBK4347139.1 hypothetical protein [Lacisediminihabitans changchengi]
MRNWCRSRPTVGGLLVALAGVELFFSGQLDIGKFHVQLGIEGLQATIVPIALVALGILAIAMPVHRIFYGVIALALSVYSLIGVNLGGFVIGMLLGAVGGVLVVAWMPKDVAPEESPDDSVTDSPSGEEFDAIAATPDDADESQDEHADEGAKRPLARGRR